MEKKKKKNRQAELAVDRKSTALATPLFSTPTIQSRKWARHALSGQKSLLPGEDAEEYFLFSLAVIHQYSPGPMPEILCAQLASALWRLSRLRKLEAVALVLSRSSRSAFERPPNGVASPHLGDLAKPDPANAATSLGDALRWDFAMLTRNMEVLSKYEARLFHQVTTLLELLRRWAIPGVGYGRAMTGDSPV